MKKRSTTAFIFALIFAMMLTACGGGSKGTVDDTGGGTTDEVAPADDTADASDDAAVDDTAAEEPEDSVDTVSDLSGTVTLWTFADGTLKPIIPLFNKKFPNVKIDIVQMEFGEMHDKALTAIASGSGGPDIVMIEGGMVKKFNTIEGLENLLEPQYDAGAFRGQFPEGNWDRWTSLDGQKLIGFPWDMPPGVTYYRADIMEENGFPSDPIELADFMKNPDNVLDIAKTLKAQDKYIFEWRDQPMYLLNSGIGFFDRDLNWLRNTESWVTGLDFSKFVTQQKLSLNQSIWAKEGQQAINSGKLVFVYLGSWGQGNIMDWGQSGKGKWRATTLPFGAYGGNGGSTLSITSQSKNKELAWEFIKFALASEEGQTQNIKDGIMPGWLPAWDLPAYSEPRPEIAEFFGGQNLGELYRATVEKIPPTIGTPLDDAAGKVFGDGINKALDQNEDSKAALAKIADDVERAVSIEKKKLLEKIGKAQ